MMEVMLIQIHLVLIFFLSMQGNNGPKKSIVLGMMVFGFGLCNGLG
jgi:hypothetical protein